MKSNEQITGNSTLASVKKKYERAHINKHTHTHVLLSGDSFLHTRTHIIQWRTHKAHNFHISNNSFLFFNVLFNVLTIQISFYQCNCIYNPKFNSLPFSLVWMHVRCKCVSFCATNSMREREREFIVCQLHSSTHIVFKICFGNDEMTLSMSILSYFTADNIMTWRMVVKPTV